jgi:hypothetical protein
MANIIDMRTYTIKPRRLQEYIELFDRMAIPMLLRHYGPPLGYYISDSGELNQVVHLWGFDSLADMEAKRAARDKDPDFAPYLQASADLVTYQESRILKGVKLKSLPVK